MNNNLKNHEENKNMKYVCLFFVLQETKPASASDERPVWTATAKDERPMWSASAKDERPMWSANVQDYRPMQSASATDSLVFMRTWE